MGEVGVGGDGVAGVGAHAHLNAVHVLVPPQEPIAVGKRPVDTQIIAGGIFHKHTIRRDSVSVRHLLHMRRAHAAAHRLICIGAITLDFGEDVHRIIYVDGIQIHRLSYRITRFVQRPVVDDRNELCGCYAIVATAACRVLCRRPADELHLRLVMRDEQVVVLELPVSRIGVRSLVHRTVRHPIARHHRLEVRGVFGHLVHRDAGLATPSHEAVAIRPVRHRCIGRRRAQLHRIVRGKNALHGELPSVVGRLRLRRRKPGRPDAHAGRAREVERRLDGRPMHGNAQVVVHDPLVDMTGRIHAAALDAACEVVAAPLPEVAVDVHVIVQRPERRPRRGVIQRGDLLVRTLLCACRRLEVRLAYRQAIGPPCEAGQIHVVLDDGNDDQRVVLLRAQVAGVMGALDAAVVVVRRRRQAADAHRGARADAHVRAAVGVAVRRREAVDHLGAVRKLPRHAARVHGEAAQGAHRLVVAVLDACMLVGHGAIGRNLANRRHTRILDDGSACCTYQRAHVQPFAAQRGDGGRRVRHAPAAAHLAVVDDASVRLAGEDAAQHAGVGDQADGVVGGRDAGCAVDEGDVLDARVVRAAHQHAAAEVCADIGVLQREVLDDGAVGAGEQAGVRLRGEQFAVVLQALDGVTLTVERALERQVDGAEDQAAVLLRNRKVGFGQSQIVVQNDIDTLTDGRTRQADRVQQIGCGGNMIRPIGGLFGMRLVGCDEGHRRRGQSKRQQHAQRIPPYRNPSIHHAGHPSAVRELVALCSLCTPSALITSFS